MRERGGTLTASVPYRTVDRVTALAIAPDRPNPARGVQLPLTASAVDERGAPVVLGDAPVRWTFGARTANGPRAVYDTQGGNVTVTATLGTATATTPIRVGEHVVAVPAYAGNPARLRLYRNVARRVREHDARRSRTNRLRLSIEVFGDGNGVPLRASFTNRYGEKQAADAGEERGLDRLAAGRDRAAARPQPAGAPDVDLRRAFAGRAAGHTRRERCASARSRSSSRGSSP